MSRNIWENRKLEVVIPISIDDYLIAKRNIPYIIKYLNPERIVLIAAEEVGEMVRKEFFNDQLVSFVDQDSIIDGIDFMTLAKLMKSRGAEKRTGWYYQQFLKMGYSTKTENDFYLVWDSELVPLKALTFFSENDAPFFSIKTENHEAYFNTMKSLLGIGKTIDGSFIAEHMLINTEIMRKMICEIEEKHDKCWVNAILDSIDDKELPLSGFSEFETYGSYCTTKYGNLYSYRTIEAIRDGKKYFGDLPREEILSWLSIKFDTISFEKWEKRKMMIEPYNSAVFRKIVDPAVFIRIVRKIYS